MTNGAWAPPAGLDRRVRVRMLAVALASFVALPVASATGQSSLAARTRALELAYNLDQAESLALTQRTVEEHPSDPAAVRTLATLAWLKVRWSRMSWSERNELWQRWRRGETLGQVAQALRRVVAGSENGPSVRSCCLGTGVAISVSGTGG